MRAPSAAALVVFLLATGGEAFPEAPSAPPITRADVLASYMRFERTYREHPPAPEDRPAVSRAFGYVTLAFFRGGFAEVVKRLDQATARLRPSRENSLVRRLAEALRVRVEPPIVVGGDDLGPTIHVYPVYRVETPAGTRFRFSIRVRIGERRVALTGVDHLLAAVAFKYRIPKTLRVTEPGLREVEIVMPDGTVAVAGRWFVTTRSLDAVREENAARLAALEPASPALEDARAIARDRNGLLRDRPDRRRTIHLVTNPIRLAAELAAEIDALERGRDPYAARSGHLWRRLHIGRLRVPTRIYVPDAVKVGIPLPLVVALHGAGADENVFPEGYGAGRIVELAEEHRFVLASPLTTGFMGSRRCLPALLEAIEHHVRIDRTRVYVLGHSLGAMAAAGASGRTGRWSPRCSSPVRSTGSFPPPGCAPHTISRRRRATRWSFALRRATATRFSWETTFRRLSSGFSPVAGSRRRRIGVDRVLSQPHGLERWLGDGGAHGRGGA